MASSTSSETTTDQKLRATQEAISQNIYPYALAATILAPPAFLYPHPLLKRVRLLTSTLFVFGLDTVLRTHTGDGIWHYATAPSRSWIDWAKTRAQEKKLKEQEEAAKGAKTVDPRTRDLEARSRMAEERLRRRAETDADAAKELLKRREERARLKAVEKGNVVVNKVEETEQAVKQEVKGAKSDAVEVGMKLLNWWRNPESWSFYWNPEGMVVREINERREG